MSAPAFDVAGTIARVRARVMEEVARQPAQPHATVRADAGQWQLLAPGVERKLLWERGGATSCMVRLAPGASFPAHGHPIDEETVILEGSLWIGPTLLLRAGDFHVGRSGMQHEEVRTDEGCVCFLRTASSFFEPAAGAPAG
ncbi:cupin domain-containing protein [Caenimonas terrae]|uniref:Cupin domain-containing protein n=1 Tax=Caenimonas terrae TaxID=696074 RepID=A0ABW0NAA4_9BURK